MAIGAVAWNVRAMMETSTVNTDTVAADRVFGEAKALAEIARLHLFFLGEQGENRLFSLAG